MEQNALGMQYKGMKTENTKEKLRVRENRERSSHFCLITVSEVKNKKREENQYLK